MQEYIVNAQTSDHNIWRTDNGHTSASIAIY